MSKKMPYPYVSATHWHDGYVVVHHHTQGQMMMCGVWPLAKGKRVTKAIADAIGCKAYHFKTHGKVVEL